VKGRVPDTRTSVQQRVSIRPGYGERELRERVKQAGGYWNPDRKAWHLDYRSAIEPGLEQRIIDQDIRFQLADMPAIRAHLATGYTVLPIVGNTANHVRLQLS
jgi:hypothetical protein